MKEKEKESGAEGPHPQLVAAVQRRFNIRPNERVPLCLMLDSAEYALLLALADAARQDVRDVVRTAISLFLTRDDVKAVLEGYLAGLGQ